MPLPPRSAIYIRLSGMKTLVPENRALRQCMCAIIWPLWFARERYLGGQNAVLSASTARTIQTPASRVRF